MNDTLKQKLEHLPISPGIYFHKSNTGEIIYVGKAAVLKNRVKQYFQSSRGFDNKTLALVNEIYDVDWIETESEVDALFLESEMVKRYMPRYNVLLRDDKSQTFVRIDLKSEWPMVSFTRNPLDDGAEYIGPFYNAFALKKALRYLRKVFPYLTSTPKPGQSKLNEDLGLSPRMSDGSELYKLNLRRLIKYIRGDRSGLVIEIEKEMKRAAKDHDFERAVILRNRLGYMKELQRRVMFGDDEFLNISKDMALSDLAELLGLKSSLRRIEGYDISHMSGTNVVASMVVFQNGASSRADYRKFKTKVQKNDDFWQMNETITRRFSATNIKSWGMPDLVLIDGGKGQLDAALQARDSLGQEPPFIGLAKKREQIVVDLRRSNVEINETVLSRLDGWTEKGESFVLINLPHSTHIIKLLQRIRDESHRFAVSYHTVLKRKQQTQNILEEIPGVGPKTRTVLLRKFGSVKAVIEASEQEVALHIGSSKAKLVKQVLGSSTKNVL